MEKKKTFSISSTAITVILVVLKLMGVINCSWLICFLPAIIGFALVIIMFVFMMIFMAKCASDDDFGSKKKQR